MSERKKPSYLSQATRLSPAKRDPWLSVPTSQWVWLYQGIIDRRQAAFYILSNVILCQSTVPAHENKNSEYVVAIYASAI